MPEEKKKDERVRNWTIVVYPESAPKDWESIVDDWHLEWVCSPLHEHDMNANGEPKKPHYHVLLMFGGIKSYEQVVSLIEPLNCPIPQRVHNAKAMVRYMAHLDNPEKHQYSIHDIKAHGGVDLSDLLRPAASERYSLVRDMIAWVKANKITEYQDLLDYAATEHFDDWFPLLCDSCTMVVSFYIKSQRHRSGKQDPDCFEAENLLDQAEIEDKTSEEMTLEEKAEAACSYHKTMLDKWTYGRITGYWAERIDDIIVQYSTGHKFHYTGIGSDTISIHVEK